MGNKVTWEWEDILESLVSNGIITRRSMNEVCIILRQAEKDGRVCIDPPTESELALLIFETMNKDNISGMCSILAKAISERISGKGGGR